MAIRHTKTFLSLLASPAQFFLFGIVFLELVLPGSVSRWISIPWIVLASLVVAAVGLSCGEEKQKGKKTWKEKTVILFFASALSIALASVTAASAGFAVLFVLATLFLTNSFLEA